MALPKLGEKKNLWDPNCGNAIAEIGRKKNCFGNCDNGIAENDKKQNLFRQLWKCHCRKWKKKKKILLAIGAMALLKMGKKKGMLRILWKSKKKVVTSTIFLQHFHNKSHMISYY